MTSSQPLHVELFDLFATVDGPMMQQPPTDLLDDPLTGYFMELDGTTKTTPVPQYPNSADFLFRVADDETLPPLPLAQGLAPDASEHPAQNAIGALGELGSLPFAIAESPDLLFALLPSINFFDSTLSSNGDAMLSSTLTRNSSDAWESQLESVFKLEQSPPNSIIICSEDIPMLSNELKLPPSWLPSFAPLIPPAFPSSFPLEIADTTLPISSCASEPSLSSYDQPAASEVLDVESSLYDNLLTTDGENAPSLNAPSLPPSLDDEIAADQRENTPTPPFDWNNFPSQHFYDIYVRFRKLKDAVPEEIMGRIKFDMEWAGLENVDDLLSLYGTRGSPPNWVHSYAIYESYKRLNSKAELKDKWCQHGLTKKLKLDFDTWRRRMSKVAKIVAGSGGQDGVGRSILVILEGKDWNLIHHAPPCDIPKLLKL
ncbi:hypothetical protein HK104_000860, partial [Borealophlyctis nickersoniae]